MNSSDCITYWFREMIQADSVSAAKFLSVISKLLQKIATLASKNQFMSLSLKLKLLHFILVTLSESIYATPQYFPAAMSVVRTMETLNYGNVLNNVFTVLLLRLDYSSMNEFYLNTYRKWVATSCPNKKTDGWLSCFEHHLHIAFKVRTSIDGKFVLSSLTALLFTYP